MKRLATLVLAITAGCAMPSLNGPNTAGRSCREPGRAAHCGCASSAGCSSCCSAESCRCREVAGR